jgi:hypothetical protein
MDGIVGDRQNAVGEISAGFTVAHSMISEGIIECEAKSSGS